jgi:hypothetical protein
MTTIGHPVQIGLNVCTEAEAGIFAMILFYAEQAVQSYFSLVAKY